MRVSVVFGAGGFIGSNLVNKLKKLGHYVYGIDRHYPYFLKSNADTFIINDNCNIDTIYNQITHSIDEVYQLSTDLGASFNNTNICRDADIFTNNLLINISVLKFCVKYSAKKVFFSSSAWVYPNNSQGKEDDILEYKPLNEYGWEKIFSEHLYKLYEKQYNIKIYIGRIFNLYGPNQIFNDSRARFVPSMCKKIILAKNGDTITVFGNGKQEMGFLFIDDCINSIITLINSDINYPINIGTNKLYNINTIVSKLIKYSNKDLTIINTSTDEEIVKKNCDITLSKTVFDIDTYIDIDIGLQITYNWILSYLE